MPENDNSYVVRTLADLSDQEREAWERNQANGLMSSYGDPDESVVGERLRWEQRRLADAELKLAEGLGHMSRAILVLSGVGALLVVVLAAILVTIVTK